MELNEQIKKRGRPHGRHSIWTKHDEVHWIRELNANGELIRTDAINPDCEYCKRKPK